MSAFLPAPPKGRTLVLGAGKAAGSMAQALETLWPQDAVEPLNLGTPGYRRRTKPMVVAVQGITFTLGILACGEAGFIPLVDARSALDENLGDVPAVVHCGEVEHRAERVRPAVLLGEAGQAHAVVAGVGERAVGGTEIEPERARGQVALHDVILLLR